MRFSFRVDTKIKLTVQSYHGKVIRSEGELVKGRTAATTTSTSKIVVVGVVVRRYTHISMSSYACVSVHFTHQSPSSLSLSLSVYVCLNSVHCKTYVRVLYPFSDIILSFVLFFFANVVRMLYLNSHCEFLTVSVLNIQKIVSKIQHTHIHTLI